MCSGSGHRVQLLPRCGRASYFYPNQSRRLKTHQSQRRVFRPTYVHISLVIELASKMVVFRLEAGINCASKENLIGIKISSRPICEISISSSKASSILVELKKYSLYFQAS